MIRADMISTVGRAYLTSNIENDEYSYPKAFSAASLTFVSIQNSAGRKFEKLALLNKNVLGDQSVRQLTIAAFREILKFIEDNILPFINDKSTSGQDLLNLFFVTFNKYVCKSDKNQAFTPDHITDFMAKITGVNKHSVVLDEAVA